MPTRRTVARKAAPQRPVTAVERIADDLRKGIKTGRFAPGQRLIEADLTRLLGVSRGPLREAMARLAGDGLVTIEPNRGVTVKTLTRAEVRGIAAIRETIAGMDATQHLMANHVHVFEGRDRCTLTSYLRAEHFLINDRGDDSYTVGGFYVWRLARGAEGWRAAAYALNVTWSRGNRGLLAMARRRAKGG